VFILESKILPVACRQMGWWGGGIVSDSGLDPNSQIRICLCKRF